MTVTSINSADTSTTATTLVTLGLNTSANVYTVTADTFYQSNVRNDRFNTQTFQVGTAFTLDSIYLEYKAPGGASYADGDITLSIYNVDDVNAATLTLGSLVVAGTFTSDATTRAAAGFTNDGTYQQVLQFTFTGLDQVELAATTGTTGYAIQFTTTTGTNPVFAWQRNATGYAGGNAYNSGTIPTDPNNGTPLDYTLAFAPASAVPEPGTVALVTVGLFGAIFITRRRYTRA
jgi:hypothetical protein